MHVRVQRQGDLDEGDVGPVAFALNKLTAARRGEDPRAGEDSGELRIDQESRSAGPVSPLT
jgi:hypothetical protein